MPTSSIYSASRRRFLEGFGALTASSAIVGAAPWISHLSAAELGKAAGRKARIGFIGVGSRGRKLMSHLVKSDHADVVAICDLYPPNYDRALREAGPGTVGFSDYRKLLEMPDLDGVVIATPLHAHAHQTIAALDRGLHVFCEKAMARTLDDCRAMVAAKARSGKVLMIGHQRLFDPKYLKAIGLARQGKIGAITQVRAYWHRNSDWRRKVPSGGGEALERYINWRLYREYSGGLMTELGTHQIQVANWFFDDVPQAVMGSGSVCYWKDGREVDDQVAVIYEYSGGRKLIYDSLLSNRLHGLEEQILGSAGTLEPEINRMYWEQVAPSPSVQKMVQAADDGKAEPVELGGSTWKPEIRMDDDGVPIVGEKYDSTALIMEAFAAASVTGRDYEGALREGYHSSIAALLAEQAMETGEKIAWPREYVMPKGADPAIDAAMIVPNTELENFSDDWSRN